MTGPEDRRHRGHRIEARIATALEERGLRILERNFSTPAGEIDIIAMDGESLVMVEVRSRRPGQTRPRDTVNRTKRRRIVQAARGYLMREELEEVPVRFDVVEVICEPGVRGARVTWLKDAFDLNDL